MEARAVEAGRGLGWYGEGWRAFRSAPGVWIVMIIIAFVIAVVLNFVPLVGWLVLALVTPALIGGLLFAAREGLEGRDTQIGYLFAGFTLPGKLNPMLVLGAIMLALNVGLMLVMFLVVGGTMGAMGMFSPGAHMHGGTGGALFGLVALLMIILSIGIAFAFFFAIPLVMFTATAPVAAVQASFAAALKNIVPLIIFAVIYIVLAIIATLPFGLGYLILMPVTFGAVYAAYSEVMGVPPTATPGLVDVQPD